MEKREIAIHISSYFDRLRVPGFGRFAIENTFVKEQRSSHTTVVASVTAHIRFGPAYYAPISEDVVLVVNNDAYPSVESEHCWFATWDAYWARTIPTFFAEAQAAARNLFGRFDEDNDLHVAAAVLVASEGVGPYPMLLSRVTSWDETRIAAIGDRLIEGGIWTPDSVDCEGWYEASGDLRLYLDSLVGAGFLRSFPLECGSRGYGLVNTDLTGTGDLSHVENVPSKSPRRRCVGSKQLIKDKVNLK